MSRSQLGSLSALSLAFSLSLVACGEDNDIKPETGTPAAQNSTPADTNTDTQTGEDLSNADQLTSGDTAVACEPSACGTPTLGTSCCTSADDVSAVRAVVAGHCGVDMSAFGFSGCTQQAQPGVLDEACPAVDFPPGPPMPGCCTAAGHCGGMETFVGFGCTSNPDAATWVTCPQWLAQRMAAEKAATSDVQSW
ncbi:MAG: hypothetical protein ABI895_11910 [Deltaproteobacteria bacterium]